MNIYVITIPLKKSIHIFIITTLTKKKYFSFYLLTLLYNTHEGHCSKKIDFTKKRPVCKLKKIEHHSFTIFVCKEYQILVGLTIDLSY